MEKFLLLSLMISTCLAEYADLSGKVFVFPKETSTDHVKLQTTQTTFSSLTVCLRFLTDLSRTSSLFSMSTLRQPNSFLLYKPASSDIMELNILNTKMEFKTKSFPPITWHSVCATWHSDNGIAQVWVDGKPSIKRFVTSGEAINGKPIIVLGQEQDSYGGGFEQGQSFIGMISKVHVWNNVLTNAEIKRYMNGNHFTPGNVLNWKALDYTITGKTYVEEDPENV